MRKDVKAGLVLALFVVIVAGWYYSGKKSSEPAIPLAKSGEKSTTDKKTSTSKSTVASRNTNKPATRTTRPRTTTNTSSRNRTAKPDAASDSLASSGKAGSKTNRSGRSNTAPGNGSTDSTKPADGLEHVTSGLANMAKPKNQAIPPAGSDDSEKSADAKDGKGDDKKTTGNLGMFAANDKTSPKDKTEASNIDSKTGPSKDSTASKDDGKKVSKSNDAKPNLDGSERYIVQPGDSFTLLAEVYYGSQSHAGFLMRANPQVKDPKRLLVGTEIRIPELPKDSATGARASAGLKVDATPTGRTYVVKAGDSLTSIAEKQLGATARWKELYELNKDVIKNPDVLRSGVVLVLPKT
ncbi:MAG TPA: LysM domain-containing protein [Phycisphaerae bacterium]|nr:LysM domain-containing protein [Phycisphaerae bacterium]